MKWFKHDCDALHDAKVEKLVMKYGIEGYGLYFACVEIIAGNLGPDNFTFELEHDAEILAYKFKVDTLKVEEIMKYCVNLGLFELNGNNRITCMKLAKRLDNTTLQNPQLKETLSNLKQLKVSASRLDYKRLEDTREEKSIMSGKPDATPPKTVKVAEETAKVEEVIAYLNKRAGTHFKASTKAHAAHVKARLREGMTVNELKMAIVWCWSEWKDDAKMEIYIRPDTIFGTKCDGYKENYVRKRRNLTEEDK